MPASSSWFVFLFYPNLVVKLHDASICGLYLMYITLYVSVATISIVGILLYLGLLLTNVALKTTLDNYQLLPQSLRRFFNEVVVQWIIFFISKTDWELLNIYVYIYTYPYVAEYYKAIPEEWEPYIGIRGIVRFSKKSYAAWLFWRSRAKHRRIARARIYRIFRKPARRRARVLYRVLYKGWLIAKAVRAGKKQRRVLVRWIMRVLRRWHEMWNWFCEQIYNWIASRYCSLIALLKLTYRNYMKEYSGVWPIKVTQDVVTTLFLVWSFCVRIVTLLLLLIILL